MPDHSAAIKFLRDNGYTEAADEFESLLEKSLGTFKAGESYSALQTRCPGCGEVCRALTPAGVWAEVYCRCVPEATVSEESKGA